MQIFILALVISLVVSLGIYPLVIPFLHKIKFGQSIRQDGPQSHLKKKGTPTMGGFVFVLVPIAVLALLMPQALLNTKIQIVIISYVGYSLIGFIDDFLIGVKKNNDGLSPSAKFLMQTILAVIIFFMYRNVSSTGILIPFTHLEINLGWFYFVLILVMFTAESNAVNLTDGLDGLSSGCVLIALAPFILFSITQGEYGLAVFLMAVFGSLLAYLKNNFFPAKIFMGDTGSLALGGLLAAVAMVLKQEILLVVIGGIFVLEVVSVIIQVTSFKLTRKRVFRMAPLHHHFELGGMNEKQVVLMFWCIEAVFACVGYLMGVL
ncbi:phospho-N-acetylmuramoyl-pentapeptide-transferase [uncultured Traorella sp.]|uniref:phospho-N-acetylmuramoyl-pentapeptide- transferase n=1 Tax=uncultured Traorella sp. TaxID=1929048 RepID=UPI0025D68A1E|nr:phospho-N-acetylmuramoyl-pentapeptide-transferase [uncultured Traorella sp.]